MKKKDKEIKMYSMFYPKNKRSFKSDYPELLKNHIFKDLSNAEMLFVWYFACEASPFYKEYDDSVRCKYSLVESFGKRADVVFTAYNAGKYPEKVRSAINEMRSYKIGPRVRSKMMVEKIMKNYEYLVDIDPSKEFKDENQEEDWSKKKAYIDACANISKTLPNLISQAEGSFGIVEDKGGDEIEIESSSLIDEFHSQ